MSFQAGVWYFDRREIAEGDAAAIERWTQFEGCGPTRTYRQAGLLLAHTSRDPRSGPPSETQPAIGPRTILTFDGRLDNSWDLRAFLRQAFDQPASSARLAVGVYEHWGTDGLVRLIGDWSLALWDAARQTLVFASDYAGVRPLYYCAHPDKVVWSTRLQPLVDWTRASDIDDVYVAGLLAYGGCPNRTPYRGIQSVPAGHTVEVNQQGTRIRRFWTPPTQVTIQYGNEWDYEDHLLAVFREAVRCRISDNAPCLCELSGGLDSSSVVAAAAEAVRQGVRKPDRFVTLTFEREGSLDQPFYTAVEETFGFASQHLTPGGQTFVSEADADEVLPTFRLPLMRRSAETARELGATTYLTGQLGDLIMGNWWDDYEQIAGLLRRARVSAAVRETLEWSKLLRVPATWIFARALRLSLPKAFSASHWNHPPSWSEDRQMEDSITVDLRKRTGLSEPKNFFSEHWIQARPERRKHFHALLRALDLRTLQPPQPLEHLDYTHPYGHRPLVEFMFSIPAEVVCRPGKPRRLMRRALDGLWPTELRNRRSKDAFGQIVLRGLGQLSGQLLQANRRLEVVERGYVDGDSFRNRLERLSMSLECNESQLRHIVLLELWLRRHRLT